MLYQRFRVSIDTQSQGQAAPWYKAGASVALGSTGMSLLPPDMAQLSQRAPNCSLWSREHFSPFHK